MRTKPCVVAACAACWLLIALSGIASAQDAGKKTVTAKPKATQETAKKVVKATKVAATTAPGSIPAEDSIERTANAKIEAALDASLRLSIDDAPLREAIDYIQQATRIPIIIDTRGLDDAGITSDTPVTVHLRGVSLRSALRLMLRKQGLTYRIDGGLLTITTPEEAENKPSVRIYPVADLLYPPRPSLFSARNDVSESYDALIKLITATISMDSWSDVGGAGSIEPLPSRRALVISQTDETQRDVANLLRVIRELRARTRADDNVKSGLPVAGLSVLGAEQQQAEKHILKILAVGIQPWHFDDAPLSEVVDFIRESLQIPITIDTGALDDAGMTTATPVTLHLNGVPPRSALRIMLDELDLTYIITDEVLLITTPEEAENQPKVRVYPVADLVRIRDDADDPDYDRLIECITSTVVPDSWSDVGGAGQIVPFTPTEVLIIRQTDRTHRKIENLFAALRHANSSRGARSHSKNTETAAARVWPKHAGGHDRNASEPYITVYGPNMKPDQLQELSKAIRVLIKPDTWGDQAGMATIQIVGDKLLVRQTAAGHRMVRELIDGLTVPSGGLGGSGLGSDSGVF